MSVVVGAKLGFYFGVAKFRIFEKFCWGVLGLFLGESFSNFVV